MSHYRIHQHPSYSSARKWAIAAAICLGITAVYELALLMLFPSGVILAAVQGSAAEGTLEKTANALNQLGGFIQIITAISFIGWMWRSYRNLPSLGAKYLDSSPSWALWGWIVPFVSLVRPVLMVRELWSKSDTVPEADLPGKKTSRYRKSRMPRILLAWWLLFLGGGVLGWLAAFAQNSQASGSLITLLSLHCIALMVSALLGIRIVLTIQRKQEARHEHMLASEPLPTPSSIEVGAPYSANVETG